MMNEEREALRAENAELRRLLDEYKEKCAKQELENGDLRERLCAAQRGRDRLNAQMEIIYLIFGGRGR